MGYGDFKGVLSADFPSFMNEIIEFAKDVGIKTDEITIIGFDLDAGENHPGRADNIPPEIEVYLLAVHNNVWKGKYKTFGEYWNNEKELKVLKFETKMNLQDLHAKYLKRFGGRMIWPLLENNELSVQSNDREG